MYAKFSMSSNSFKNLVTKRRWVEVIDISAIRCATYDFLLVFHCKYEQVNSRWCEHFRDSYNPHTVTAQLVLDDLPFGYKDDVSMLVENKGGVRNQEIEDQ